MKRVIVGGSLAQRAMAGGHAWVFLQYLLGFRRLGWDVVFIDRLEPDMCRDARGSPCPVERSEQLRYLLAVLGRFGLTDRFAVLIEGGRTTVGLERRELLELVADGAFLLNVMGFIDDIEVLAAAKRRVFLDIDPGFGQMWHDLGLHDPFAGHDDFVTIGENVGREDCFIPSCGRRWITTPQPVVLDEWPATAGGDRFTSVGSWRGAYGRIEYGGRSYGLRVHEFRRFFDVPRLACDDFELALDIHSAERDDIEGLRKGGWLLADPRAVAGNPDDYRRYVQGSLGEFMVAKQIYVATRSGWFSDRSICYLASGKPVIAQDTGFAQEYRTGEGLLPFTSLEEALAAVEEVGRNLQRHRKAARDLAEKHFDSDVVLNRLVDELNIVAP